MPHKEIYVICDNLRSLENIGSIFRTADAFRINKVYLTGISGCPPHKKISKTALGAENWVKWEYHKQAWRLIEKIKKQGVKIIALEKMQQSLKLNQFKPKYPIALVIGNEVNGVSQSLIKKSDETICIPMQGKKESLNVAVAFGIAAYSLNLKRNQ